MMPIEEYELIETIFAPWKFELGDAYKPYRGHVYRQFNFACALVDDDTGSQYGGEDAIRDRFAIASAFHDVGLFLSHTMNYLGPSKIRMGLWLDANDRSHWKSELDAMVEYHHKITPYREEHAELVEPFRKADLVDVSLGILRCGLPRSFVREVRGLFPNEGFHRGLVVAFTRHLVSHPLHPLPMMRR